jgi:hypothetical protein
VRFERFGDDWYGPYLSFGGLLLIGLHASTLVHACDVGARCPDETYCAENSAPVMAAAAAGAPRWGHPPERPVSKMSPRTGRNVGEFRRQRRKLLVGLRCCRAERYRQKSCAITTSQKHAC